MRARALGSLTKTFWIVSLLPTFERLVLEYSVGHVQVLGELKANVFFSSIFHATGTNESTHPS